MKRVLVLVVLLISFGFTKKPVNVKRMTVEIAPESVLFVHGMTNVKGFKCEYKIDQLKSPIDIQYYHKNGKIKLNNTSLVLNNVSFDCGGKAINKDFVQLLKTDDYPQIKLTLKEIHEIQNKNGVNVLVDIEMAGKTNAYVIPVSIKNDGELLISGDLDLGLNDFGIIPPTKFLGLVHVDDIVEIGFKLYLKEVR
ncbi:YceI family protein [Tamlana fucoidanivorans]|uniref:YceI family protein n=1 Tax=Allotamlana fucoidanivorans TaxID=2583814 RepID=A0A5C4SF06_9FLAO|nr:YceI family protein [Tamlana fucoidanivorans]TNJ42142.1 YceI family protein [Tamlana fucoidanivorans]